MKVADGFILGTLDTDLEKVLAEHLETNPRLRDFVEGDLENHNFKSGEDFFYAFYNELHGAGFSDKQKNEIFTI